MTGKLGKGTTDIKQALVSKVQGEEISFIVDMANKYESNIDITLFVHGLVICGVVISGKEYHSRIYDKFPKDNKVTMEFASYFKTMGDKACSVSAGVDIPSSFIHLDKVKVLKGDGGTLVLDNSHLRLKIEEIDGHIIGSLS